MISLGDVNFALGADTRDLQRSIQTLQRFGTVVDSVQTGATRSAEQSAAAFRKQEAAITSALNATLRLQQQMRKVDGGERFANQAGSAFRQLNDYMVRGERSTLEYQRAMERFRASTQNATRGFKDFSVAQSHVNGLAHSMKGLQSSMVLIQGPLGGLATRVSTISSLMGETGAKTALFVAGFATASVGVYKFGQQLLDAGKQVNAFMGQFTAVTGNADQAGQMFDRVTKIARHTGQQVTDLAPMFARFTIAANGTGMTMKEVEQAFTVVAAAGTKLQLTQEQSMGTFRALEQMMSKGTIQAEELRGQLGDRLPGAVSIMARALGVTTAELQKMMKAGDVLTASALPKFIAELARTLNIDTSPVDNYTAAVNNNATAWFQLRAELDKQFGVTDKVVSIYKGLTNIFDNTRTSLEEIRKVAIVAGAALIGLATPALLGTMLSLVKAFGSLTKAMLLFNAATMANPLFAGAKLAVMIAGAIAAIYPFRDELKLIEGDIASVGDYFDEIWERMAGKQTTVLETLSNSWTAFRDSLQMIIKEMGSDWELSWINIGNAVIGIFADIVNTTREATIELVILMEHMFNNIMADLQSVGGAMNSARHWLSPWLDDPKADAAGNQVTKGMEWYEKLFKDKDYEWKDWDSFQRKLKAALANSPKYVPTLRAEDIQAGANKRGLERIYNDPSRGQDIMIPGGWPGTKPFELDPAVSGTDEVTEKETKALNRKVEALKDVNDELRQIYQEMGGLQQTEAELNRLNEQWEREDKVERYRDALIKAGVATELVNAKTKELATALATRDMFEKQRESVMALRDSMVEGFDAIGESILNAFENGEDAGEAFAKTVKAVVNDVLDTIIKLTLLNPLKNWLFGTDMPTIDSVGGFMGALKGSLPGLFGGNSQPSIPFGTPSGFMDLINAYPKDTRQSGFEFLGQNKALPLAQSTGNLGGGNVAKQAWDFFKSKGLTDIQTAGILGNIKAESAFNPSAIGDGGKASGLFQHWPNRGGGQSLIASGASGQLQHAWNELQGPENSALRNLRSATTLRGATAAFAGFERPLGYSDKNPEAAHNFIGRLKGAEEALQKFGGTTNEIASGAKNAASGLTNLGSGMNQFGQNISRMQMSGMSGSGGSGGGLLNSLFGGGSGFLPSFSFMNAISPLATSSILSGAVGLFHSGGTVGHGGGKRYGVNPTVFANAPRFHNGLGPDEYPAILQRGETVNKRGSSGANGRLNVNNTIINNSDAKVNTEQRMNSDGSVDLITTIDQAVAERLSRNGTQSNKALKRTFGARSALVGR